MPLRTACVLRFEQLLLGRLHHDLHRQSGDIFPGIMREKHHDHDLFFGRHRVERSGGSHQRLPQGLLQLRKPSIFFWR